jgi:hypothetical protein
LLKDLAETTASAEAENGSIEPGVGGKKPFVEPEIEQPVDVLEATTFFVSATSGGV